MSLGPLLIVASMFSASWELPAAPLPPAARLSLRCKEATAMHASISRHCKVDRVAKALQRRGRCAPPRACARAG